jgi:hypothetical protein
MLSCTHCLSFPPPPPFPPDTPSHSPAPQSPPPATRTHHHPLYMCLCCCAAGCRNIGSVCSHQSQCCGSGRCIQGKYTTSHTCEPGLQVLHGDFFVVFGVGILGSTGYGVQQIVRQTWRAPCICISALTKLKCIDVEATASLSVGRLPKQSWDCSSSLQCLAPTVWCLALDGVLTLLMSLLLHPPCRLRKGPFGSR